jgi:conjugative transposon TraK protein
MFNKLKNMETAFQHVRLFTIVVVAGAFSAIGFMAWQQRVARDHSQDRVYVLAGNTAWAANAVEKNVYLPISAKGHVRAFHELFFTLDPDEKANRRNLARALDMADESARKIYDSLSVSGYYANVIAGNIRQRIVVDSVEVDTKAEPYRFRCYAHLHITRATSQVSQSLITSGELFEAQHSDTNILGLLIRHWTTVENKIITINSY